MPLTQRFFLANTWLLEPFIIADMLGDPSRAAGIRTTTAATMISGSPKSNILPTRAEAVVNFRIMPGESSQTVRDHVVDAIDDERVDVSLEMAMEPPGISETDSDAYRMLAGSIRAMDEGIIVVPYMVRGGTDAKWFNPLSRHVYRFNMGKATPETMRLAHGINEHVSIEDYLLGVRFFYLMLKQSARADL